MLITAIEEKERERKREKKKKATNINSNNMLNFESNFEKISNISSIVLFIKQYFCNIIKIRIVRVKIEPIVKESTDTRNREGERERRRGRGKMMEKK